MNLRRQIAVTVAAVSILVALSVGLLVHQASVNQHVGQARTAAENALRTVLEYDDHTGDLPKNWNAARNDPAVPQALRGLAQQGHLASLPAAGPGGTSRMWAAAPGPNDQVISIWIDYTEDQRAIADLDRSIALSAALSVLVTVLAGVLVAHRISRRLRTAARTARTIAQGDLGARIGSLGRARDEVAELAAAVDSMSAVLSSKLANEQRFTADVAHELRTPLTGLLTAAELLPPGRPTELVQDRVRVLCRLTEELLEVSRLDNGAERPELSRVPLGPMLRRILPESVHLEVRADAEVTTDPRRLDRVVGNLVANAERHGAPPVLVTVDGPVVTVRDHGPGFPDEVLADGPQRFRTGARERGHGHGLGLTIAQGHAAVLGVRLILANHPDGGAQAELVLG
ncbi:MULTISPECIES: sensor histidine kinase [Kitasatospora]|uniref:sensor histidine kinase n=1 Tax=Kitasatospora TaxID=2063 RepID=UPI000C70A8A5|nr:HAMP domain-containing sensor histidine kinase [Kitasatospora sp. GP30]MDH6140801.1 signal transduction histidine kinase [Kitasatospora sp. GP30]